MDKLVDHRIALNDYKFSLSLAAIYYHKFAETEWLNRLRKVLGDTGHALHVARKYCLYVFRFLEIDLSVRINCGSSVHH